MRARPSLLNLLEPFVAGCTALLGLMVVSTLIFPALAEAAEVDRGVSLDKRVDQSQAGVSGCRSELEQQYDVVHCLLKKRGHRGLPSLSSFRRLSKANQYRLLKRPAARYRIEVDPPREKLAKKKAAGAGPVINITEEPKIVAGKTDESERLFELERFRQHDQALCKVFADRAMCGTRQWRRIGNEAAGRQGQRDHSTAEQLANAFALSDLERQTLKRSYTEYIRALAQLGIADTAMSLTRYIAVAESIGDAARVSRRLEQMLSQLQSDLTTQTIPRLSNRRAPTAEVVCEVYETLLVCDDVKDTWIYR